MSGASRQLVRTVESTPGQAQRLLPSRRDPTAHSTRLQKREVTIETSSYYLSLFQMSPRRRHFPSSPLCQSTMYLPAARDDVEHARADRVGHRPAHRVRLEQIVHDGRKPEAGARALATLIEDGYPRRPIGIEV